MRSRDLHCSIDNGLSAEPDLQAAAIGLADDDDVAVAELGTRDPATRDVVDVRAVRRALIDRDELALHDSDPHVLARGAMVVDEHVGDARLATDDDPARSQGEALA